MAYDELLADRMRQAFNDKSVVYEEQKMMGGLGFMVDDKLCIGIYKEELMARIDPDEMDQLLKRQNCRQMQHGKRMMKGYINVEPLGFDNDVDLEFWIDRCLEFNPRAKSSKKKK